MIKRAWITNTIFFIAAPIVGSAAVLGLWLAFAAVVENHHLGSLSEQIVRAVARAREMRIPAKGDAAKFQGDLIARLIVADGMRAVPIDAPVRTGAKAEEGVETPWGRPLRLFVYPADQAVRFETVLSRVACRKLLAFYAEDAGSLGLLRVDAREDYPSALWRLVHEQPRQAPARGITTSAIQAGCGRADKVVVSLTFSLK